MGDNSELLELGDFELQSGAVLSNAKLAYKTYGQLNASHDNMVLLPTCLLYTSPSPRDKRQSRMPSSA